MSLDLDRELRVATRREVRYLQYMPIHVPVVARREVLHLQTRSRSFIATVGICLRMRERDRDTVDLERAVQYPQTGPRTLPIDAWTENRPLEDFLRKALQTQSAGAVAARYGLQCMPSDLGTGCTDCFICRATIRE